MIRTACKMEVAIATSRDSFFLSLIQCDGEHGLDYDFIFWNFNSIFNPGVSIVYGLLRVHSSNCIF